MVDLGVRFDSKLLGTIFQKKINKAYIVLGIIKRNFVHMDEHTFVLLYKSMVRPHMQTQLGVHLNTAISRRLKKIRKGLLNF